MPQKMEWIEWFGAASVVEKWLIISLCVREKSIPMGKKIHNNNFNWNSCDLMRRAHTHMHALAEFTIIVIIIIRSPDAIF